MSKTVVANHFNKYVDMRVTDKITCQGCKQESAVVLVINKDVLGGYVLQENGHIAVDHFFVRSGAFSFHSMVNHSFSEILNECKAADII